MKTRSAPFAMLSLSCLLLLTSGCYNGNIGNFGWNENNHKRYEACVRDVTELSNKTPDEQRQIAGEIVDGMASADPAKQKISFEAFEKLTFVWSYTNTSDLGGMILALSNMS